MKQVLEENKFSIEEQMDLTKLAIPNIIPAPIEKAPYRPKCSIKPMILLFYLSLADGGIWKYKPFKTCAKS